MKKAIVLSMILTPLINVAQGKATAEFGSVPEPGPSFLLKCIHSTSQTGIGTPGCASCETGLSADDQRAVRKMSFVETSWMAVSGLPTGTSDIYIQSGFSTGQPIDNIAYVPISGFHAGTSTPYSSGYKTRIFNANGNAAEIDAYHDDGASNFAQIPDTADLATNADVEVCCGTVFKNKTSCTPSWTPIVRP